MLIYDLIDGFYMPIREKNNVLIICPVDVDALCATKMLINLFKMDNITYTLKCVYHRKQFESTINENISICSDIVCINCGGNVNLTKYNELGIDYRLYLLDSYQPWNLKNIYDKQSIHVIIDREEDLTHLPSEEHIQDNFISSDDKNDNLIIEDDDDESFISHRNRPLFYSEGTRFTIPSCKIIFELLVKLRKDNLDALWCTICGITYNFFSDRLSRESYISMVSFIQQNLLRISMNDTSNRDQMDTYKMNISYKNELNLFLYRHWSLLESMFKSLSTSCSFKIWTVKGKKRLLEYLAHAGLPLKQCQQKYNLMSLNYKNKLNDILEKNSERFRVKNLIIPSFVAYYGYQLEISALDVVFCIMTSLDFNKDQTDVSQQFLNALQILDRPSIDIISSVIEDAKYAIEHIFTHIQSFIDLHYVISAGPFHLGVIPEGYHTHIIKSVGPMLEFCAKYLLNAHVSLTKNKQALTMPLILCLQSTDDHMSTIIGIPAIANDSSTSNNIGDYFKKALNRLTLRVYTPFFKKNIIQIPSAERAKFLDMLIEIME